jgi:hypothetical protein
MIIAVLALCAVSCAQRHNSVAELRDINFDAAQGAYLTTDPTIQVVDEADMPIGNAQILIGEEPGKPFGGNVLTSDQNGLASIPGEWKAELPITISAKGYVTRTYPETAPEPRKVRLSKQEGTNRYEVKGDTTDFGKLITDGKVDFALVMPTLNRNSLLSFDLSTVVSSEFDTLTILGNDFEIPSNITLPDQTENYIFPIHFDKPTYRHIFRDKGQVNFFASHGQFPIQKVVGDIRSGKSIFEVINYFTFLGGGYKAVDVKGDVKGQDVKVDEIKLDGYSPVVAPTFGTDKLMFSLSMSEKNNAMTPYDLKRLVSKTTTQLKTWTGGGLQYVISLMLPNTSLTSQPMVDLDLLRQWPLSAPLRLAPAANQDFSQLSLDLESAAQAVNPTFVPWIAKPTVTANRVSFSPPSLPTGLTMVATYAVYTEIETTGTGSFKNEKRTRLWEMFADGWVAGFDLPKVTFTMKKDRTYRWEVMFMARPTGVNPNPTDDGTPDLTTISHISRNVTNL